MESTEGISDMLKRLGGAQVTVRPPKPRPATPAEVQRFLSLPLTRSDFDVGDIVVWRKGYADHSVPDEGQECVVTQVFNDLERTQPTSGGVMNTNDIALAFFVVDNEGNDLIIELPFDSRRFEYALDEDGLIKHVDVSTDAESTD